MPNPSKTAELLVKQERDQDGSSVRERRVILIWPAC